MSYTFKIKMFGYNDIIPTKPNQKVTLTVEDDKLIIKFKNKTFNLYYNYFDLVELGIYKGNLLFQSNYHSDNFVFSLSKSDWLKEGGITLLKNINKFVPILDPIKIYKIKYEPSILRKKDFASTEIKEIKDQIKSFESMNDYNTSFDKQMMVLNLYSFLIKRLMEDDTKLKKDTKQKANENNDITNAILDQIERVKTLFNKNDEFGMLLIYNYYLLINYTNDLDLKDKCYNEIKDLTYKLYNKKQTIYSRMQLCDCLYDFNFEKEHNEKLNKDEIFQLLKELKKIVEETNDYHFILDYCSTIAILLNTVDKTPFESIWLDLLNELGNQIEKLIDYLPISKNYALLNFTQRLKSQYYYDHEDLIETKNSLIKEKELALKSLAVSELKSKKNSFFERLNRVTEKEKNDYLFQLANAYTNLCNIGVAYQNTFDQLSNLREAIKIHDKLISINYYEEDQKDEKLMSLLTEYSFFINVALENNYEDMPFVGACIMRLYTLAKIADEKDKDDTNEEVKGHLVRAAGNVVKLTFMTGEDGPERCKYLNEMLNAALKLEKINPNNSEAHDAKTFVYYNLFNIEKDKDEVKAKELAKLVLDSIQKVDQKLLELDDYKQIIEAMNDYINK